MDSTQALRGKTLSHHKLAKDLAKRTVEEEILPWIQSDPPDADHPVLEFPVEAYVAQRWLYPFLLRELEHHGYVATLVSASGPATIEITKPEYATHETRDVSPTDWEYIRLMLFVACILLFYLYASHKAQYEPANTETAMQQTATEVVAE